MSVSKQLWTQPKYSRWIRLWYLQASHSEISHDGQTRAPKASKAWLVRIVPIFMKWNHPIAFFWFLFENQKLTPKQPSWYNKATQSRLIQQKPLMQSCQIFLTIKEKKDEEIRTKHCMSSQYKRQTFKFWQEVLPYSKPWLKEISVQMRNC